MKVSHMKCHRLHAKNDCNSEGSKKKTKNLTWWCFFFCFFSVATVSGIWPTTI